MEEKNLSQERLDQLFNRFFESRDNGKKQEIAKLVLQSLKSPDYLLLIQNNNTYISKFEVLLREMWASLKMWDIPSIRSIYLLDTKNFTFQLYYTKAIVNSGKEENCEEFLKSVQIISGDPEILGSIYDMGDLTGRWEYAALLLSSNGIYDERIMSKYLQYSSNVINSQIIKNLKEKSASRELLKFLKVLSAKNPENTEINVEYLEALLLNKEIPTLTSILKVMDLDSINDEASLIRVANLLHSIGEYQKSSHICNTVLANSSSNEEAIELQIKNLNFLSEWERVINFSEKNLKLIKKSQELEGIYLNSCLEVGNYRSAVDTFKNQKEIEKLSDTNKLLLAELYLKSDNESTAREIFAKISKEVLNTTNGKKVSLILQRIEGIDNEYIQRAINYIRANQEDYKFVHGIFDDLFKKRMNRLVCDFYKETNQLVTDQSYLSKILISHIEEMDIKGSIELIKKIGIEKIEANITICFLKNFRTAKNWQWPEEFSIEEWKLEYDYISNLREFFVGGIEKAGKTLPNNLNRLEVISKTANFIIGSAWLTKTETEKTFEEIASIVNSEKDRDINFLNYPLTTAYIQQERYEDAYELLKNSERGDDPYFKFLELTLNKKGGSPKLSKALESLFAETGSMAIFGSLILHNVNEEDDKETLKKIEMGIKSGASIFVPWNEIYAEIKSKHGNVLANFQDLVEYCNTDNLEILRLKALFANIHGKKDVSEEFWGRIFRSPWKNQSDMESYLSALIDNRDIDKILDLENDFQKINIHDSLIQRLGTLFLEEGNPGRAEKYFKKVTNKQIIDQSTRGIINSLLAQDRIDEALKSINESTTPVDLKLRIFLSAGMTDKLNLQLKSMESIDEMAELVIEDIMDKFWENRILRNSLIQLSRKTGNVNLCLDISSRLQSEGKSEESLQLLKLVFHQKEWEYQLASALLDKLSLSAKFEEMTSTGVAFFKSRAEEQKKRELFTKLTRIQFNNNLFNEILKLYNSYEALSTPESMETVILTLIKLEDYMDAGKLLSKYHLKLIDQEDFEKLTKVLKRSENNSNIIKMAEKLMKACVKEGRFFDKREAITRTNIDISKIDEIYEYLLSPVDYSAFDPDYLESQSSKSLRNIFKKTGIETIEELTLPDFFLGVGMKDIELARVIKTYVDDSYYNYKIRRVPRDNVTMKYLSQAINLNSHNPILFCISFNIGIREAMRLREAIRSIDNGF